MSTSRKSKISRREFIRLAGITAASATWAACSPTAPGVTPTAGSAATEATAISGTPAVVQPRTVRLAVGGWAEQNVRDLLANGDFTEQTGIDVEIVIRTDNKETELARLASAVQSDTSPYDVVDFEDELATSFSRANYLIGLDDLLPSDFWEDFPPEMIAYSDQWSSYNGETFRIIHNWEMPYWWYRKDWFDDRGVAVPTTWDEVKEMGEIFTDEGQGTWASVDGLIKGAFLNVYLSWVTLQAGGNPFDVGDEYREALQYTYDLMYSNNVLNPASLQMDYNQQNAAYIADSVAFMRQWPFFGDVARSEDNQAWFEEDKVAVALPPAGPGGVQGSTYAAGWGFGIVRTSPNLEEARELLRWLVQKETAVEAMKAGFWFLNARHSVLEAADQDNWLVQRMKMYTDAGVIGVRPFHPAFVEALTIIEDTAASYLTDQIGLEESLEQARTQLAELPS